MVAYKTGPCNEDKMQLHSATGFSIEAAKCQSKWYLQHKNSTLSYTPVHDTKHLFANVLCSLQCSDLYKVLVAPSTRELVVTPRVVDGKQCQMITLGLVKLGFLLIGNRLLVL